MYRFATQVDPDSIYALSRFAYAELALNGVTHVGEFHYVHHQPDGTPYDDRTAMADAVIRAARVMGHAGGGEILVTDLVRLLVDGKDFEFEDRGPATLKGFAEPVRLFSVAWSGGD